MGQRGLECPGSEGAHQHVCCIKFYILEMLTDLAPLSIKSYIALTVDFKDILHDVANVKAVKYFFAYYKLSCR